MVNLLIADDHFYVAEGIEGALGEYKGINIVGRVYQLEELEEAMLKCEPDVVLLDIKLSGASTGIDFIRAKRKKYPEIAFVVFSEYDSANIIKQAYDVGAASFLSKNTTPDLLSEAIKQSAEKAFFMAPDIAEVLASCYVGNDKSSIDIADPKASLSEREFGVFLYTAKGYTQSDVSGFLSIAVRTVAKDIQNCKEKLGLKRTAQFTMLAMRRQLLPESEYSRE
ncbi:MAG: hypothetical protein COA42_14485 [Alteromonadaceae bacterium]|nr:MAG: hypothetical protein COA42_14485 [Alteromonadaceae bacterium]